MMRRNFAYWPSLEWMTLFSAPLVRARHIEDFQWWTSYVVYPSTVED